MFTINNLVGVAVRFHEHSQSDQLPPVFSFWELTDYESSICALGVISENKYAALPLCLVPDEDEK
jgi:hypothetical protein